MESAGNDKIEPDTGTETEVVDVRSDATNWAKGITHLDPSDVPEGAINLNVAGRRVTSPVQGFGQLWQKTYRISLGDAVTPTELIKVWKARFPEFWPKGNSFYGSVTGIAPGDVALLNLRMPGHIKMSTGILVLYADDESFTFMTPEGHGFAAFITFSGAGEGEGTVAQVQALVRAMDPFYEMGMITRVQGRMEDRFWKQTLTALAAHFGVENSTVGIKAVKVDKKRQWKNWKNIRYNAFLRSVTYMLGTPFRAVARPFRGSSASAGRVTEDEGDEQKQV